MEYVYAAMLLDESAQEVNEENVTAVLEAAGVDVEESRVKALVAALEDVDIAEAIEAGAAMPAAGGAAGGASAESEPAESADDEAEEEDSDEASEAEEAGDDDDEDEEASGEGLGELFG